MAPSSRGRPSFRLFSNLKSMQELQETLGVTENQLWCVELEDNNLRCAYTDAGGNDCCIYPAVKRNHARGGQNPGSPRCALHAQHWFPKCTKNSRGHLCLGPQYFRGLPGGGGTQKTCIIGYSKYTASIKRDDAQGEGGQLYTRADVVQAMFGATSKAVRHKILVSDNKYSNNVLTQLAPWHFAPKYRILDEATGTWCMKKYSLADQFVDEHGKTWNGLPPPDYDPRVFVQEEMHGGQCRLPKNHFNLRSLSMSPITGSASTSVTSSAVETAATVRNPVPAWVGGYLKAEGMEVIHTLDTLDIPPSLAPFSLANVNQAWQDLSPQEMADLNNHRNSRRAMMASTTTTRAANDNEDNEQQSHRVRHEMRELEQKYHALLQQNQELERRNEALERENKKLQQQRDLEQQQQPAKKMKKKQRVAELQQSQRGNQTMVGV